MWAGEMIGLVTWWVEDDCRTPEEDVAAFVTAYVVLGTYGTLDVPAPTLRQEFHERPARSTSNI